MYSSGKMNAWDAKYVYIINIMGTENEDKNKFSNFAWGLQLSFCINTR